MLQLDVILAQDAAAAPEGGGFGQLLLLFGPLLLIFIVINYLLVTRPQQREQAKHQGMLGSLKKNDRVLTAGGVIGTVVSLSEDKKEITLRVDDNTRIKFRTEYVRGLLDQPAAEPPEGSKAT
jgi:preprotein translocase subunit YajC